MLIEIKNINDAKEIIKSWKGGSRTGMKTVVKKLNLLDGDFKDWLEISSFLGLEIQKQRVANLEKMRIICTKKMEKKAKSFEDWYEIYKISLSFRSLKKLVKLAQSIEENYIVLSNLSKDHPFEDLIVSKKISSQAKSFEDWTRLYHSTKNNSVKELCLQSMVKISIANPTPLFKQWHKIFECSKDEAVEKMALEKMSEFNESFEQWKKKVAVLGDLWLYRKIYLAATEKNKLKEFIIKITEELQENFYDWLKIWSSLYEDSPLKTITFKKMMSTAKGYWEWKILYNSLPEGSSEKELALKMMAEDAQYEDERHRVCSYVSKENPQRENIVKILKSKKIKTIKI